MTDYSDLLIRAKKGTTLMSVKKKLQDHMESQEYVYRATEIPRDDLVTVKSNYARDRIVPIGDMNVKFNSEGEAKIPRHHVPAIRKHMAARPGRFIIVEEAPPPVEKPRVESLSKTPEKVVESPKAKAAAKVPEVSDKPKVEEVAKVVEKEAVPTMTVKVSKKEVTKKESSSSEENKD